MEYEQASCAFLKEVVQGNKMMKRVKEAAEGIYINGKFYGEKISNSNNMPSKMLYFSSLNFFKVLKKATLGFKKSYQNFPKDTTSYAKKLTPELKICKHYWWSGRNWMKFLKAIYLGPLKTLETWMIYKLHSF